MLLHDHTFLYCNHLKIKKKRTLVWVSSCCNTGSTGNDCYTTTRKTTRDILTDTKYKMSKLTTAICHKNSDVFFSKTASLPHLAFIIISLQICATHWSSSVSAREITFTFCHTKDDFACCSMITSFCTAIA